MINANEGVSDSVYADSEGNPTIGAGYNLNADKAQAEKDLASVGANFYNVITGKESLASEQINKLTQISIDRSIKSAKKSVSNFDSLPQPVKEVVIDITYNTGSMDKFPKAKKAIESGDYAKAAQELIYNEGKSFTKYFKDVGKRASDNVNKLLSVANNVADKLTTKNVKGWATRGAVKAGLIDPSTVNTQLVEQADLFQVFSTKPSNLTYSTQRATSSKELAEYAQEQKLRGKFFVSNVTESNHMTYTHTHRQDGTKYIPAKRHGTSKVGDKYPNTLGVGHFILDADYTDGYQHGNTKNSIAATLRDNKPAGTPGSTVTDPYMSVYENNEDGSITLKYIPISKLSPDDKIGSHLRQYKYSDIDWNSRSASAPAGFMPNIRSLMTKDGKQTSLLFPGNMARGKDFYGQFGGTSAVFLDRNSNMAVSTAGSINHIASIGKWLMDTYNINPDNLIVAFHDLGSFSAKPAARDGATHFDDYSEFNFGPETGAALLIPE